MVPSSKQLLCAAIVLAGSVVASGAQAALLDVRVRGTETGAELLFVYDTQPTSASATAVGEHVMISLSGAPAEIASLPAPEEAGVRSVEVLKSGAVIEAPQTVLAAHATLYENAVGVVIDYRADEQAAPESEASLLAQVTGRRPVFGEPGLQRLPQPKDDFSKLELDAGVHIDALRRNRHSVEDRLALAKIRLEQGNDIEARFYFQRVLALRPAGAIRQQALDGLAALDAR